MFSAKFESNIVFLQGRDNSIIVFRQVEKLTNMADTTVTPTTEYRIYRIKSKAENCHAMSSCSELHLHSALSCDWDRGVRMASGLILYDCRFSSEV